MLEKYFPQGVAEGESFIGREEEQGWLSKNIKSGYHTLLLAPRRYGKTSLALTVLKQLKIPYTEVNFQLIVSPNAVENKIIEGVQDLLKKTVSTPEKILKQIQSFFKRAKKTWRIGFKGVLGLEITPDNPVDISGNILTALQLLEHILVKGNKKAVIFFDEIQEIDFLKESKQIEGAIREFAQNSKKLTFIFSGSNRGMLLHMFDDRSMPLYELCDRIILNRIPEATYQTYLTKVSKKTLGYVISTGIIDKILMITKRHPKRVYNLCFYLWRHCMDKKKAMTVEDVSLAWSSYLNKRVKDVRYNLSRKGGAQIKLLTLIATGVQKTLTSQIIQKKLNLSSAALTKALQVLEEQDYIEKSKEGYRILDPLIKDVLLEYEQTNL